MSIASRVLKTIQIQLGMGSDEVSLNHTRDDLNMDSLDDVEVIMAIEEEFDIELEDGDIWDIKTVQQMIDHVTREIK